jgi:hypothetical protein
MGAPYQAMLMTGTSVDPYTVLLAHYDGTTGTTVFTDEKGHSYTYAGFALSNVRAKFGGTSALGGVTNYVIKYADSADWDFGSGDFTIEAWVSMVNYNSSNGGFICTKRANGAYGPFNFYCGGSGELGLLASTNGTTWGIALTTAPGSLPTDGSWTHVAVTRSGATFRLFTNGTVYGSVATSSSALMTNTDPFCVGGTSDGGGPSCVGYIDEVRVSKGIARYTSSFTPSTIPFTIY